MATPSGTSSYGHHYHDIEWRFTGTDSVFYGMDPLMIVLFPLAFFGIAQGFAWIYFIILTAIALLIVYISFMTPYKSVLQWSRAQRTRYIQGCKWPISD